MKVKEKCNAYFKFCIYPRLWNGNGYMNDFFSFQIHHSSKTLNKKSCNFIESFSNLIYLLQTMSKYISDIGDHSECHF